MEDSPTSSSQSTVDPPSALLGRDLAETLVLLEYLSTRPEGFVWPTTIPKNPALTQSADKTQSSVEQARVQQIEQDLATLTTTVRRIYAIRSTLESPIYESNWDFASEAAFLSRAKSFLSELASPATSLTIAFTSMVLDANVRGRRAQDGNLTTKFAGPVSEIAYPNLSGEVSRLSRSIRFVVPYSIALVTLLAIIIIGVGNTSVDTNSPPRVQSAHWLAKVALSSGVVPAMLGILGALASVLRQFQHLSAASLLDPGLRSKNRIEVWLGFIAGSSVGFLGVDLSAKLPGVNLALYPAAFIAGYSTEIAFSLLDLIIVRFTRIRIFRDRTPQLNSMIKSQSAIADTVSQIHDQIAQIQGNVTLDPFDGAVIVYARGLDGSTVAIDDYDVPLGPGEPTEPSDPTEPIKIRGVKLTPGQPYELVVALDRNATNTSDRVVETFSTGTDSDGVLRPVAFDIEINGRGIRFTPKKYILNLDARSQSGNFFSKFVAPNSAGRYDMFAEVSQKNRLVKVAHLTALIERGNV